MLSVTPTESAESVFFVMSVAVVVVEAPVAVAMTVLTPEPSKPPTLVTMVTSEMRVVMRALLLLSLLLLTDLQHKNTKSLHKNPDSFRIYAPVFPCYPKNNILQIYHK